MTSPDSRLWVRNSLSATTHSPRRYAESPNTSRTDMSRGESSLALLAWRHADWNRPSANASVASPNSRSAAGTRSCGVTLDRASITQRGRWPPVPSSGCFDCGRSREVVDDLSGPLLRCCRGASPLDPPRFTGPLRLDKGSSLPLREIGRGCPNGGADVNLPLRYGSPRSAQPVRATAALLRSVDRAAPPQWELRTRLRPRHLGTVSILLCSAATYSPGALRPKYHRRWQA